jgi:hypothetical protein
MEVRPVLSAYKEEYPRASQRNIIICYSIHVVNPLLSSVLKFTATPAVSPILENPNLFKFRIGEFYEKLLNYFHFIQIEQF